MPSGGGWTVSRRGWAGITLASWMLLTVCLGWGFDAAGLTAARTTVWIVTGVSWPLPVTLAIALVDPEVVGVRSVRAIAHHLLTVLALGTIVVPLVLALWALYAWLWPGSPDTPPTGLLVAVLVWSVIGMVAMLVAADKGDRYHGGWAP